MDKWQLKMVERGRCLRGRLECFATMAPGREPHSVLPSSLSQSPPSWGKGQGWWEQKFGDFKRTSWVEVGKEANFIEFPCLSMAWQLYCRNHCHAHPGGEGHIHFTDTFWSQRHTREQLGVFHLSDRDTEYLSDSWTQTDLVRLSSMIKCGQRLKGRGMCPRIPQQIDDNHC